MLSPHKVQTIEESMATGLSQEQAWLRELVLVFEMDIETYNGDFDTSLMHVLCSETGKGFTLDPMSREGYCDKKSGRYTLYTFFEHKPISRFLQCEPMPPKFDGTDEMSIEAHLKSRTAPITYELSFSWEGSDPELFDSITSAYLTHTLDTNLKVEVTVVED